MARRAVTARAFGVSTRIPLLFLTSSPRQNHLRQQLNFPRPHTQKLMLFSWLYRSLCPISESATRSACIRIAPTHRASLQGRVSYIRICSSHFHVVVVVGAVVIAHFAHGLVLLVAGLAVELLVHLLRHTKRSQSETRQQIVGQARGHNFAHKGEGKHRSTCWLPFPERGPPDDPAPTYT